MPPEFDALVVGSGIASAAAAAALASGGLRVGYAPLPRAPAPPAALVAGRALLRAPDWARALPRDRPLSERRLLLLGAESAVSLEFDDPPRGDDASADAIVEGGAWVVALQDVARRHGAAPVPLEDPATPSREPDGRIVGVGGRTANLLLGEAARGSGNAPAGAAWTQLWRRYPMASTRLSDRFGVARGHGAFWECRLGFVPPPLRGAGYLLPGGAALQIGVVVSAPLGRQGPEAARATLDALERHPSIAPVLRDAGPPEEVVGPASVGAAPARPAGGPGWLAIGEAPGGPFTTVGGAPSADRELWRGLLAASSVLRTARGGPDGSAALARYRSELARFERRCRQAPRGVALAPPSRVSDPALAARALHELMHESGRPKEPVVGALRRLRRVERLSWYRLGVEALGLTRSL